jgi:hypothetical protein
MIQRLQEKNLEMLNNEKEKEEAISQYVLNATHFEEEIQKAESNLAKEQESLERCKKVVGNILEYLNRFFQIQGVNDVNIEAPRWNSTRIHSSPLSIPQSHPIQFTSISLEQLEDLPKQVEGRLSDVLNKPMENSHLTQLSIDPSM